MRQPLELLIDRYQKNLFAAAFNVCANAQDAEDVVQDTFLQYYSAKNNSTMKSTSRRGCCG